MPDKITNPLWDYFKISNEDPSKAVCALCNKTLSRGSREPHKMTTTNLQNHLKKMHQLVYRKIQLAHGREKNESTGARGQTQIQKSLINFCASTSKSTEKCDAPQPSTSTLELKEEVEVNKPSPTISKQPSVKDIWMQKEKWQHDNPKARAVTRLIGEMICLDLQPYSIVDDTGFNRLMKHVTPNYIMPSRSHFSTKVIPLLYEATKSKVKHELGLADFISLTTDGWTCQHTIQSFYSLTARYLMQNYEVRNVILQVKHFPESHTGSNIAKFIDESLQEWDIPERKVQMVLTDNAANVLSAIKESNLTSSQHLPCVIHTMQLCIQNKLFKEQRAVTDAIAVFRSLASHFHHSSSGVAKLREIQIQLNLPEHKIIQDVATRWNSTYYMLERFCEQRKAIALYCISRSQTNVKNPTENQWNLAEMLVCILQHFEKATKDMSRDDASISQIIPFIHSMENFLEYACDSAEGIKTVVNELKTDFVKRFQKYKENDALKTAMVLDPRFKLKFIDESQKNLTKETLFLEYYKFNSSMNLLDKGFENKSEETDSADTDTHSEPDCNSPDGSDSDGAFGGKRKLMNMDIYSFFHKTTDAASSEISTTAVKKHKKRKSNPKSTTETVKEKCMEEVNSYLSLPDLSIDECPYKWWSAYRTTRGNSDSWDMARFAKKVLCAPPSSVMSERLFSTTGNVFDAKRNRLLPEHGEQIAFLNYNLPAYMDS